MKVPWLPLRFEPIFKPVLWGGTSLRPMLRSGQSDDRIGEAWLISDVSGSLSRVAEGPFAGSTLRDLLERELRAILGKARLTNERFPLLLKLLDAREPLSVQVHPTNEQAARLDPTGPGLGKTEAWVILRAEPGSLIYAGTREGVGRRDFESALRHGTLPDVLHSFEPRPGDCVFLEAGTVHAIGAGIVLFEVQQSSDITYRLYDWGRMDAKTGQPRQLHIEQALICSKYEQGPCHPVAPRPGQNAEHERLIDSDYFTLDRWRTAQPFHVRTTDDCRILAMLDGEAVVECEAGKLCLQAGDAVLLPAAMGGCRVKPSRQSTLLECGVGE